MVFSNNIENRKFLNNNIIHFIQHTFQFRATRFTLRTAAIAGAHDRFYALLNIIFIRSRTRRRRNGGRHCRAEIRISIRNYAKYEKRKNRKHATHISIIIIIIICRRNCDL